MNPLTVELIPDPDEGGFTACLPDIPAYGEGETEDEAIVKGVNIYGRRWTKIIAEFKKELSTVKERNGMNIKDRWDTMEGLFLQTLTPKLRRTGEAIM